MNNAELHALLTLQHVPNLGDVMIKRLLARFETAQEVLKQKKRDLMEIEGIGEIRIKEFYNDEHKIEAEKELNFIRENNIECAAFTDGHYPDHLKKCVDAPVLLFSRGKIDLKDRKIISIVGTRKVTSHGVHFTNKLIEDLAPLDPVIISGFAYGVDIAAHTAAVANGLQTVGVVAHGLNQIYPKTHKKHLKDVEANGGIMTDFWSSDKFDRKNFLQRNRIIAGISEATIVIESASKGGSLVTADFANSYNRDVFAVPGRPNDQLSLGCNNLIKATKANLLTSAADLVYILGWDVDKPAKSVQKLLFVELDDDERKIYNYLKENEKDQLDFIARGCGLPIFKVASVLLNMELKGVIRPLPGRMFELV